jgi:hypothetical protein
MRPCNYPFYPLVYPLTYPFYPFLDKISDGAVRRYNVSGKD